MCPAVSLSLSLFWYICSASAPCSLQQGAFSLAKRAQVPIVPISLIGPGYVMPNGKEYLLRDGKIVIKVPLVSGSPFLPPWMLLTSDTISLRLLSALWPDSSCGRGERLQGDDESCREDRPVRARELGRLGDERRCFDKEHCLGRVFPSLAMPILGKTSFTFTEANECERVSVALFYEREFSFFRLLLSFFLSFFLSFLKKESVPTSRYVMYLYVDKLERAS